MNCLKQIIKDAAATPEAKDVARAVKLFSSIEKDFWKFKKALDDLQASANADNIGKLYSQSQNVVRLGSKIADAINHVTSQIEDIK